MVWEDLDFLYHDRLRGIAGVQRVYVGGRDELDDLSPRRADVYDVVNLTGRGAEPEGYSSVVDINHKGGEKSVEKTPTRSRTWDRRR